MLKIGCHLSTSKGYEAMGKNALSIGANTFQFFSRNPRGSKAKDIDPSDVEKLLNIVKENNFAKLLAHAPYTLNPSSNKPETREFAKMVMEDDLRRMEYLPYNYYNPLHCPHCSVYGNLYYRKRLLQPASALYLYCPIVYRPEANRPQQKEEVIFYSYRNSLIIGRLYGPKQNY